jgi:hypothetical protein
VLRSCIARVRSGCLIALGDRQLFGRPLAVLTRIEGSLPSREMSLIAFLAEQTAPYWSPAMVCLPFDSRPIAAAPHTSEMCH